jgi:hypothetical protein
MRERTCENIRSTSASKEEFVGLRVCLRLYDRMGHVVLLGKERRSC